MHRTLQRQLKKLELSEDQSPEYSLWMKFLQRVDQTYTAADNDRYILERSLTISSAEMQELYKKQKASYENRLTSILNAMPDVLFLLTEDGKCIDIMSGNKLLLDKYKEAGLDKFAHDVYPQELADLFVEAIQQALEAEELVILNYDMEIRAERYYYEGRIMPASYEYQGKRTVVFNAIDITKRVKSEVQGRLISTVFQNSREGMLIVDQKFRLVTVNEAFCEISGESMESIESAVPRLRRYLLKLDDNKDIIHAIRNKGYWIGEITAYNKAGGKFPVWLTINTVKDYADNIINYVVMITDISKIKRSQQELEHVATHDSLTNLPNRMLFQDRLDQAIIRAERQVKLGALFFLDLDRFKNVNDNLGHQIGDDLLTQVADRLSHISRSTDTLARIGGDEFTLIVEGLNSTDELNRVAEKILDSFVKPFKLGGYKLDISVSIGISTFPHDSNDPVEIIKQADTAMYSAKESGRNTYQFFTQELTSNAFEYFALEVALGKALSRNEFFLVYQPQYDINTDNMIGVEALLRWRHPDMGVVSPNRFIHIAETTGQIEAIGEWVIKEACRQCTRWNQIGMSGFTISINLSRKQLVIPNLCERIQLILNSEKVSGKRLEFEITESSILESKDVVYENLKKLKAMGINMAIDDFGTGYSSLVNLKQFPLSRLKIDQSFVRDVTRDTNDEAIIRATIALGKSLQLKIIAEGVEREDQKAFLLNEGCDQVQGYLYSEPLLADGITASFQKNLKAI